MPAKDGYVKAVWFEGKSKKTHYDVIPRAWVNKKEQQVYFPAKGINVSAAIKLQMKPNPTNKMAWSTFDLKHTTATVQTYAEAENLETDVACSASDDDAQAVAQGSPDSNSVEGPTHESGMCLQATRAQNVVLFKIYIALLIFLLMLHINDNQCQIIL